MQISDRLKLVVSFVTPCRAVADIGTDHGYVPIELVKSGIVKKAYAMDVNQGPLERAKMHIENERLADRIEVRQSDGLAGLMENEADTVIIAGMGGELTVRILKNGAKVLHTVQELILSPHSEVSLVRRYLVENGYEIIREKMICDMGKYYTVIKAVRGNGMEKKDYYGGKCFYLYGRKLIEDRDPVLQEYLQNKKKKYGEILAGLETNNSESADLRRGQILEEMECITKTLKMMEDKP